ncbi:unnamed protein product [Polarella glacialis]|uniref:GST N-terminal domain-containing protein n=1 Tax=Polarella glacialis TaxID=89957 RepID=A0A813JET1_POLGL|nr:unnamed protein product [Polarella glacialis]
MMKVLHYASNVFQAVQSLPVVGRILDVGTATLVTLLRCGSGAFAASNLDKCRRPAKVLKLYEFEGCPYCRKVREALSALDLDVLVYPCPRETLKAYGVCDKSRYRPEVTRLGGKQTFPFFVDENTGAKMNESSAIIAYLWENYGKDATPPVTYRLGQLLDMTPLFLLPALCRPLTSHGILLHPSKKPEQPLVLWGTEGSPFVKLVREALCVLELPYLLRNIAHGSDSKRLLFRQMFGDGLSTARRMSGATTVQMPFLEDPNTGVKMLESADIIQYLYSTYQDGPASTETWCDFTKTKVADVKSD